MSEAWVVVRSAQCSECGMRVAGCESSSSPSPAEAEALTVLRIPPEIRWPAMVLVEDILRKHVCYECGGQIVFELGPVEVRE